MNIKRTTTHFIEVPAEPPILERGDYSMTNQLFRVARIQETLVETEGEPRRYSVVLSGPKRTISGKDHATQRDKASFSAEWSTYRKLAELKPEIAALLAGPEGLSIWGRWSPSPTTTGEPFGEPL